MIVQVMRKMKPVTSWDFEPNPDLRYIIEWVLGESLESFVHKVLVDVCLAIKKDITEVDDFIVRIFASDTPKSGWSYKRNRGVKKDPDDTSPDMVIGFTNDPIELEKTIIHEGLHCLWWDEDSVEAKTQELYKARRR